MFQFNTSVLTGATDPIESAWATAQRLVSDEPSYLNIMMALLPTNVGKIPANLSAILPASMQVRALVIIQGMQVPALVIIHSMAENQIVTIKLFK